MIHFKKPAASDRERNRQVNLALFETQNIGPIRNTLNSLMITFINHSLTDPSHSFVKAIYPCGTSSCRRNSNRSITVRCESLDGVSDAQRPKSSQTMATQSPRYIGAASPPPGSRLERSPKNLKVGSQVHTSNALCTTTVQRLG